MCQYLNIMQGDARKSYIINGNFHLLHGHIYDWLNLLGNKQMIYISILF